jgi:hypothetical protein
MKVVVHDSSPLNESDVDTQRLNCFPNSNEKHIDYVISCRYNESDEGSPSFEHKEAIRNHFVERLKEESIEVYVIREKERDKIAVFYLVHCPPERLLIEAERVKLEMKIADVFIF